MTRWQRFKHAFQRCNGSIESVDYRPPNGAWVEGRGIEAEQMAQEVLYGVTLVLCRCDTCGKRYTNRYVGNHRESFQQRRVA